MQTNLQSRMSQSFYLQNFLLARTVIATINLIGYAVSRSLNFGTSYCSVYASKTEFEDTGEAGLFLELCTKIPDFHNDYRRNPVPGFRIQLKRGFRYFLNFYFPVVVCLIISVLFHKSRHPTGG